MLTHDELAIVHLVLNTDCNAWDLAPTSASPGVCRFCYRERNRVKTDPDTVRRVIDQVRAESEAHRVVFTGGDPVMPYDNHLEVALRHAQEAGFETNLHTNGLLLSDRYAGVRDHVTLYSLAIDGPEADSADWFRGQGYFERFRSNVEFLVADRRRLAFNGGQRSVVKQTAIRIGNVLVLVSGAPGLVDANLEKALDKAEAAL
ncbi:radical SAM protein [Streptomyces mirabilis]